MNAQRLDYDRIGARYDEEAIRARPADRELVTFVTARAGSPPAVLDVACGTGIQLVANRERFPAGRMVGLDLHAAMLEAARKKRDDIEWVQGDAASLPFRDGSFDFVSNQFSFHHVQQKSRMLAEIFRVLRPTGRFAMINIAPRRMPDWDVYQLFPEAFALDRQDFWPTDRIEGALIEVGFTGVCRHERILHETHRLADRLALFEERYTPSQILAIDDHAYEAGLDRIRRRLAEEGPSATIESRICLMTLVGDR